VRPSRSRPPSEDAGLRPRSVLISARLPALLHPIPLAPG
jgi:hypothetical protein